MKEITQLWTKLSDCLFDINSNDAFIKELYDKFGYFEDKMKLIHENKKKDDIKHLYNCYREELNSGKDNFNLDKYPNIPRCSIN